MAHATDIRDIHYGPFCAVRSCDTLAVAGRCYCARCAVSVGANPTVKHRNDGSGAAYARWHRKVSR